MTIHRPHPWLVIFQRTFPSANTILIGGPAPLVIDGGFGTDIQDTLALLSAAGAPPARLQLVANTHYHADHSGANHVLQHQYGLPIAAHHLEGRMVNARDQDACGASWLGQAIAPYRVDRMLRAGDTLSSGEITLQVIETPGHTLGHISFYEPDSGALIVGDVYHADDVAWLNIYREGVGAIYRMLDTLDRLAALRLTLSISGHGPPTDKPYEAIARARQRYEKWARDPQKIGWHACKRIFAYALMLYDGLTRPQIETYLLSSGWYRDYAHYCFGADPQDFIQPLLDEMIRSGACAWRDARLVALTPYNKPTDSAWLSWPQPKAWPPPDA